MKKTPLFSLFLPLFCFTPLHAQMETNANPPMNEGTPPPPGAHHGSMAQLSDAERAQLKAAHDKAAGQDPSLTQKMKEAHDAMEAARKGLNEAMIKVDPTVGPILAKITHHKRDWKKDAAPDQGSRNTPRPWKHDGSEGKGMANLPDAERQQLKSLHEQVKNDPVVAAARGATRSATTPEARQAAEKALRQASHDAMVKADPSIEPILEKLHPPQDGGQPHGTPVPATPPAAQ